MRVQSLCASLLIVALWASISEAKVLCQKNYVRPNPRGGLISLAGTLRVVEGSVCPAGYSLVTDTSLFQGPQGDKGDTGLQGPPGEPGPAARQYRFVGLSTQKLHYSARWEAMTNACLSAYVGGRIATTAEYMYTVGPPAITEEAWIAPAPPITYNSGFWVDGAGVRSQYFPTLDYNGVMTVLHTNGAISTRDAGTDPPHPVACSSAE